MLARLVVLGSLIAGTAYAQAPGETPPVPVPLAPVAAECGDCIPVMENRWSVALTLGAIGLQTDHATDQANFGGGELAVRFRATPHLEVQAALGGAQQNHDLMDSHMKLSTFELALRYRFMPRQHLNLYAMAGLGSATITSDQQSTSDARPMVELGGGVEWRFEHFAIHGELRALGIAGLMAQPLIDPPIRFSGGLSGGQALVGASYYF